jgi:hypothetical protein
VRALGREAKRGRTADAGSGPGDDGPSVGMPPFRKLAFWEVAFHVQTRSRSSYFKTLPEAFTGSASTTTARRGTL